MIDTHDQKLLALGRMTAGLTHDFNNLLSVIGGYAQMLAGQLKGDTKIAAIVNAVERGTRLTQRVIDFEQEKSIGCDYCDCVAVLHKNEVLLKPLFSSRIEVVLDVPDEEIAITCGEDMFTQILMAYGNNARIAMPQNGSVQIRLIATQQQAILIFSDTRDVENPAVDFSLLQQLVQSAGGSCGIARTKKSHDITVVFSRYAPFRDKTILVVDDEEALLPILETQLQAMGFKVLKAANADIALTMHQDNPDIDCLLTDVMMPNVNGIQLAQRMTDSDPHMRVVYMTGYAQSPEPFPPDSLVVPKPLLPDSLSYALQQALTRVQDMD